MATPQKLWRLELNQKSIISRSSRLLTLRFFRFYQKDVARMGEHGLYIGIEPMPPRIYLGVLPLYEPGLYVHQEVPAFYTAQYL